MRLVGLTAQEARERLEEYGPNALEERRRASRLGRLLAQVRNPLIVILVIAGIVTAALGDWIDSGVILAVVVINTVIGWVQEDRAQRALESVRELLVTTATVIRDGHHEIVEAREVVPGDLVVLEAGDRVPADLALRRSHALRLEESILTGESIPVEKSRDGDAQVYAGTLVVSGSATGEVTATGRQARMGRIGTMVEEADSLTTPLTRRLDRFAWQITAVIVAIGALAWIFAVLVQGTDPLEAILAVIGLAVAAIPEGLPAIISIVLAIGTRTMARERAIVRRLTSVETLGSVTVICTDKTGTLTRNEMTVVSVLLPDRDLDVTGVGYAPEGRLTDGGDEPDERSLDEARRVAIAGVLCNDAELLERDGVWSVTGDPMEGALLCLAEKIGIDVEQQVEDWDLLDEIPFDPRNRYMATLRRHRDGAVRLFVKGAPEVVARLCGTPAWQQRVESSAGEGRRVLALAQADCDSGLTRISTESLDGDLTGRLRLIGMTALVDPPRAEAAQAIAQCRAAGIRVIMVTGDHAVTAAAIGQALGLDAGRAIDGSQIEHGSADEIRRLVGGCDVIARASPEMKMRLIEVLQSDGDSVAMTGDGVNDAPALTRADIGVAMGRRGTDAARGSADLILTDDNFATITAAVREGRTVYDNIVKALQFILPTNGGEGGLILLALGLGLVLPVTVAQILWVNLVTTVTLALAFAFEPAESGVMSRPPRPSGEGILTRRAVLRIVFVSVLIVGVTLLVFELSLARFDSVEGARTAAVTMIVLAEIVYLFNVRRLTRSSLAWRVLVGNRVAVAAVGLLLVLQLGFVYLPFMNATFATVPLDPLTWLLIIGLALCVFGAVEVEKAIGRRRRERV